MINELLNLENVYYIISIIFMVIGIFRLIFKKENRDTDNINLTIKNSKNVTVYITR